MHKLLAFFFLLIILVSCTKAKVFDEYKSVAKGAWHNDSIVNFEFSPVDTLSRNNIYINLRNNKDYEYSTVLASTNSHRSTRKRDCSF